jgi:hypothetical protein
MALQKIYVDYDFNKNSILNAKLQPVTTAERNALASGYNSNDAGIIVYDTTLQLVFSWDGNQWDQVSISSTQIAQIAEAFNKTVVDITVTADNENRTIILTYRDTLSIQETYKFSHIHNQTVSSSTWNITHNLNKYPSVSVVDSSNEEVIGEVQYTNANSLVVKFSAPFSGKAFVN